MPLEHVSSRLPVAACALALGLSGCVAAPLAQIAVSQMAPPKPPCVAGPGCQTDVAGSSFGDISKGVTDSFHDLTGAISGNQKVAGDVPTK
ncbi:MAG: hypothetical protein P4L90_10285 [Rhodopila sp.]|nr:hypothetical protein [Rhodopila sp.]